MKISNFLFWNLMQKFDKPSSHKPAALMSVPNQTGSRFEILSLRALVGRTEMKW